MRYSTSFIKFYFLKRGLKTTQLQLENLVKGHFISDVYGLNFFIVGEEGSHTFFFSILDCLCPILLIFFF